MKISSSNTSIIPCGCRSPPKRQSDFEISENGFRPMPLPVLPLCLAVAVAATDDADADVDAEAGAAERSLC